MKGWNREKGTVCLVGLVVRDQVRCPNHLPPRARRSSSSAEGGARRVTRPQASHVRGEDRTCGAIKVLPIADIIRFCWPYAWGSKGW